MFPINKIREDFPILKTKINGKDLVFLDSAASAQKPFCVINACTDFYEKYYANVHRGLYYLSDKATTLYENARKTVAQFINAKTDAEIVFTRNATESINLVAYSYALNNLKQGDEILISEAEHHANIVPWQFVAKKTGAVLKVFKVSDEGDFIGAEFDKLLNNKTKLVAVTYMSNVLGTIFPVKEISQKAHLIGAKVLVDACQAAVHQKIDVQDLSTDFLVFSGHKTYGPSGIGVLYAKEELLGEMPPYQFGGDMVETVTFQKTTFAKAPAKFEAGTPAMVQAFGLSKALEYMMDIGLDNIANYDKSILNFAMGKLNNIKGLHIIGTAKNKAGVIAFNVDNAHPFDISELLNNMGVCVRAGHHCAQPIHQRMGVNATVRASFGLYNTMQEVEFFVEAIEKVMRLFR
jgi:cysteine desulfurase/selenocysteine lyase